MPPVAVRWRAQDRSEPARPQRPLIEDRCKVVSGGAGEDIVTLHERESSPVTAPPCGPCLRGFELGVRVAAEAFQFDRMCGVEKPLENRAFGWNNGHWDHRTR
jgi:hypothetical protein